MLIRRLRFGTGKLFSFPLVISNVTADLPKDFLALSISAKRPFSLTMCLLSAKTSFADLIAMPKMEESYRRAKGRKALAKHKSYGLVRASKFSHGR